jgi:hypothetical protein
MSTPTFKIGDKVQEHAMGNPRPSGPIGTIVDMIITGTVAPRYVVKFENGSSTHNTADRLVHASGGRRRRKTRARKHKRVSRKTRRSRK